MIRGSRPQPAPPVPPELLLVNRMGDNYSPILLTETPRIIATFNRTFELSELVGNLDGVMYLFWSDAIAVTCVSYEESGQTLYGLAENDGETVIGYLTTDGNNLLCHSSSSDNYLFDIDFKHQHKKFWPSPMNEVVGITCPSLLSDSSKYLVCKIVDINTGKQVRMQVNNGSPISVDDGGTIAAASWFAGGAGTGITDVVKLILQLEYDDANAGGITVTTANDSIGGVDGYWNLFTDGSEFVPLSIVSRLPGGSPRTANGTPEIVATFNRSFNSRELVDKLVCIVNNGSQAELAVAKDEGGDIVISGVTSHLFKYDISVDGEQLMLNGPGESVILYDLDFNHQFRRALPSTGLKYNVQIPQLLASPSRNEGIGIKRLAESRGEFIVFCQNETNNPYKIEGDIMPMGNVGQWANSLSWANVQSVLQKIIAMEFEGFDDTPPTITTKAYSVEESTGFTVTPLIPQTLS